MTALQLLANRLRESEIAARHPWGHSDAVEAALADAEHRLQVAVRYRSVNPASEVAQSSHAIERFWRTRDLPSFRALRLVCFGVAEPVPEQEPPRSLMHDAERFEHLLRAVAAWWEQPRRLRRCVQGLVRAYFAVDSMAPAAPLALRQNGERLRRFLADAVPRLSTPGSDPAWVVTLQAHAGLLGANPAEYVVRAGLGTEAAKLFTVLGIPTTSWLMRDLANARVRAICGLSDEAFLRAIEPALDLLGQCLPARDAGVATLLGRYAQIRTSRPLVPHAALFSVALLCWGAPDADSAAWHGIDKRAVEAVRRWRCGELIKAFFATFDADDKPRSRRAAYWLSHLTGTDDLSLVLTPSARARVSASWRSTALARRMLEGANLGLASTQEHDSPLAERGALLLRIGPALVVEFDDARLPMHAYGAAMLPFDLRRPLSIDDPAPNTLRHPARLLELPHRDGVQGWATWEARFDAMLSRQFGIEPGQPSYARPSIHVDLGNQEAAASSVEAGTPHGAFDGVDESASSPGLSAHWQTAEAGFVPFGMAELTVFARVHGLAIEDHARDGGPVVVLVEDPDPGVAWVLSRWGFRSVPGAGWQRQPVSR